MYGVIACTTSWLGYLVAFVYEAWTRNPASSLFSIKRTLYTDLADRLNFLAILLTVVAGIAFIYHLRAIQHDLNMLRESESANKRAE